MYLEFEASRQKFIIILAKCKKIRNVPLNARLLCLFIKKSLLIFILCLKMYDMSDIKLEF